MAEILRFPVRASVTQWRRAITRLTPSVDRALLLQVLACLEDVVEGAEEAGLEVRLPEWSELIARTCLYSCGRWACLYEPVAHVRPTGAFRPVVLAGGAADYTQLLLPLPGVRPGGFREGP